LLPVVSDDSNVARLTARYWAPKLERDIAERLTESGFTVQTTRCGHSRTVKVTDPQGCNPFAEVVIDDDGYIDWGCFLPRGRKINTEKVKEMIVTAVTADIFAKDDT
jgi:hypothetical protein